MSDCILPESTNTDSLQVKNEGSTSENISENSEPGLAASVTVDKAIVDVCEDDVLLDNVEIITEERTEESCRVCLSEENLHSTISDFIEENVTIAAAIMLCVNIIKIVEDDLPKGICEHCLETLKIAYKFYKKCTETDEILQIRRRNRKHKLLTNELDSTRSKKSKQCISLVASTEIIEPQSSEIVNRFGDDEIEKHMEVIHGYNANDPSVNILQRNKPLIVNEKANTRLSCRRKLLSSIKTKRATKHKPGVGKFKGRLKTGIYDSVFIHVKGYLFEYGLLKGSTRYLRCAIPSCSASGKQTILANGDSSSIVDIINPHNHDPPGEDTIRKHMFLCWIRRKMQSDKTINIRNAYEDACSQDPEIKHILPLRQVLNEICHHQLTHKINNITSFEMFYRLIETEAFDKLHFTNTDQQFYQEKFYVEEDESMAVIFANASVIEQLNDSKIMYVDASFKIDTIEDFKYQLVTVLVWIDNSYFPILFALVNKKSQLLFRQIFTYLHDDLAPELRPEEIITEFEANIYYALAEIYTESSVGGSVFYYTQNLYKKLCSLNLSRDLETNSSFRTVYHMLLMLPLLPTNTILDGLNSIEMEAKSLNITQLARPLLDYIRTEWIINVTPELFCVHKVETRINENVIAPFKKLRDFLLLTKGKGRQNQITVTYIVEKLIELEHFLRGTYSRADKKFFGRDLSCSQKKNVLRAWQYIEEYPKIEMGTFFAKVLGYIKCMENQLWIWGFYQYDGDADDILISAAHFSIELQEKQEDDDEVDYTQISGNAIVMEAVVDHNGILQPHISKQI